MKIRYTKLFSIECLHDYFDDNVCRVLTLSPTEACQKLLGEYRCRFRPTPGGGAVYCGAYDDQTLLSLFDEQTPFAFTLTSSDPALGAYTDLDEDSASPAETFYYFDNLTAHEAPIDGQERLLLYPPPPGPQTWQVLPVKQRAFCHTFEDRKDPLSGEVFQVLEQPAHRQVWRGAAPTKDFRSCALDFSHQSTGNNVYLSNGRYQLCLDEKKVLDFYLSHIPAAKQWGVVEIFAGGPNMEVPERGRIIDGKGRAIDANGHFIDAHGYIIDVDGKHIDSEGRHIEQSEPAVLAVPKTFTISFSRRPTFWRYYIVSQSGERSFGNYLVKGGLPDAPESFKFKAPTTEDLQGKKAWVFESEANIPLYQSPKKHYAFKLSTANPEPRHPKSVDLPYAQARTTRLEGAPGARRMCSEIFVYL